MKKLRSNIITLVIVSALVLFFVVKDDFDEIISVLLSANKLYIFLGILFILLGDIFRSISINNIIKKNNKKYKFEDALLLTIETNFFNGITPFSSGGQPFQLYILNKKNKIDYVTGVSVLFKDFYTYQISLVIVSTLCIIVNYLFNIVILPSFIRKLIFLGYTINLAVALFLICVPYLKNSKNKLIGYGANLLNKIGVIKDKERLENNVNSYIMDFKKKIKDTIKDRKLITICILLNVFKFITSGIVVYLCFKSANSYVPLLESVIISIIITTMASFVPIPGASGGMEYGFIALFSYYVLDVKLGAVMLIWRFLTYYMLVIFGGILFAFEGRE